MKECNFKQKKRTLGGNEVLDCAISNPTLFTGICSCTGEENCILYQMYKKVEESDI
jgi:hypothetical protein